jgi:hypothetical protein
MEIGGGRQDTSPVGEPRFNPHLRESLTVDGSREHWVPKVRYAMESEGFKDLDLSETPAQIKGTCGGTFITGTVTVTLIPVDGNTRTRLDVVASYAGPALKRSIGSWPKHITKTRGLASIITSFAYLGPWAVLLSDNPVAASAFVVLVVGTFEFHGTANDWGFDGAGMLAALAALAAVPYAWWVELPAILIALGLGLKKYNHLLVGAFLVPVTVVCFIEGAWLYWVIGIPFFLGGLYIWNREGDWPHAIWHVCTAVAMTIIAVGLTGGVG